jgi:hypothetical protein
MSILTFGLVGLCWGTGNWLTAQAADKSDRALDLSLSAVVAVLARWQVWAGFAVDKAGSLLYFVSLAPDPFLGSVVANGLATAVTQLLEKRGRLSARDVAGTLCVAAGVMLLHE